jgi:hypothetical protein
MTLDTRNGPEIQLLPEDRPPMIWAPPVVAPMPLGDIQESLKVLRFRLRRNVGFRPVRGRGDALFYRIDGKLLAESEILLWVGSIRKQQHWNTRQSTSSPRTVCSRPLQMPSGR